jgi:hypothetical protein
MQPAISRTLSREVQRSAGSACALISRPVTDGCAISTQQRSFSSAGQPTESSSSGSHAADGECCAVACSFGTKLLVSGIVGQVYLLQGD